jgi:hypothetical protein
MPERCLRCGAQFKNGNPMFDSLPEELKQDKNVKTQWALFEQSKEICSLLLYIVHRDVTSVEQSWPSLPRGMPQSTCGIMLNGTRVDNVLVGGPACSLGIERGDIITEIDGMAVTPENVHDHLLGDDIPGHCVEISVTKHDNGPVQRYNIERTPTATLLDRRRLWEQLTGLNTQPPLAARILPALLSCKQLTDLFTLLDHSAQEQGGENTWAVVTDTRHEPCLQIRTRY